MEIDQLRNFIKAAELGNFTRAAEAVGLSQPALSRSIARLEEELGQPMFERQTRHVGLTDAGRSLMARAEQILALINDAKAEIADDGRTGRIRVAAIPTIAPFLLPGILKSFGQDFPEARVIVQEDTTDNLLKKLTDGEVDVAVLARPVDARYLETEDLFEEELLLVLSVDNPLCGKKRIELTDIKSLPFVLLGEAHCLTDNVLGFCRQRAFHPVMVERTSQLAMVQELVSLDHGISMVPAMARVLDNSDRRIYRSLAGNRPTRKIILAWNPYRFQSRLLKAFKERIKAGKGISIAPPNRRRPSPRSPRGQHPAHRLA